MLNLAKSKKSNMTKSKKSILSKNFVKTNFKPDFLLFNIKKTFIHFEKTFNKAPIFWHFYMKCYISIEIRTLGNVISKVLSQIISDYLNHCFSNYVIYKNLESIFSQSKFGQWYLITFFLKKMILTKICYKIFNYELLGIVKVFKTLCHYLKGYKYKVFVFTDHNNICWFIDSIKNLRSDQVYLVQKLFQYHF